MAIVPCRRLAQLRQLPQLALLTLSAIAAGAGGLPVPTAFAGEPPPGSPSSPSSPSSPLSPWCAAPEVQELSDHVCYAEGTAAPDGPPTHRRTLVVYLHGLLATTPRFQYLQQRAMALHAKRLGFTVLLPTSPLVDRAYVWPTSQAAQEQQERGIVDGLREARRALEKRVGHPFDETFVVGFSSGAYYASSLAVRSVLDVDGYILLAGGASWVRALAAAEKRAPIFVGVSAADPQTADHSRSFAATLTALGWPHRTEERNAGHMVDWDLLGHGIGWLRALHGRGQVRTPERSEGAD